jgi:NAD-dependent SIR2 family protein deacetylase
VDKARHLFILGAGFSANAGLPLASNFTPKLLEPAEPFRENSTDAVLISALRKFVNDAFNQGNEVDALNWPVLEDIFTTIDLAANTGHHLGPKYSAAMLRTMRRALIVRLTRMLRQVYTASRKSPDSSWDQLSEFFRGIRIADSTFLSLNWDTVVESGLAQSRGTVHFDYACRAVPAKFDTSGAVRRKLLSREGESARILKPHGSTNWMYCDCCSRVFWFSPNETLKIASRLIKQSDSDAIYDLVQNRTRALKTKALCPSCKAETLGTRFATFSYRKALAFPMHLATWTEAERQLRSAKTWTFIGYSLPAADYEFKFLLKRVQLSRSRAPEIAVITLDDGHTSPPTVINYQRFFGEAAIQHVFRKGLDQEALAYLNGAGAIDDSK